MDDLVKITRESVGKLANSTSVLSVALKTIHSPLFLCLLLNVVMKREINISSCNLSLSISVQFSQFVERKCVQIVCFSFQ